MSRALIAMSGGVDSSVAAFLMKRDGYDCVGVTMRLFNNEDAGITREKTCCSLDDIEDARRVACAIGIPYLVCNFTGDFKSQVIDRFIASYERGETPNPCIDCNRYMKFSKLYDRAKELGCEYIATGHYARIEQSNGRYYLKKALDPEKDQSYVLYILTSEQLSHTRFPLGGMTKDETRRIAEEQGFSNARKKDSQDICFVPDGDYARVIEANTGKTYPRGRFVDKEGNALGEHKGIIHYTIGQRKGLGISSSEPLYVCGKNPAENEVVLGRNADLYSSSLEATDFNWIALDTPPEKLRIKAKIRYRHEEQPATVFATGANTAHIEFDSHQRAISPGQSVVLYDGDIVVGGGIITG